MMLSKLKTVTAFVLMLGMVAFGGATLARQTAAAHHNADDDNKAAKAEGKKDDFRLEAVPGTQVQRFLEAKTALAQKQRKKISMTYLQDELPLRAALLGQLLWQMAWDRYEDDRLNVHTTEPAVTLTLTGDKDSVDWASSVIKSLNAVATGQQSNAEQEDAKPTNRPGKATASKRFMVPVNESQQEYPVPVRAGDGKKNAFRWEVVPGTLVQQFSATSQDLFRLEVVPGTLVQRYVATFQERKTPHAPNPNKKKDAFRLEGVPGTQILRLSDTFHSGSARLVAGLL